jgi:glycerol-3-phosphate dehydrogenase
MMIERNPDAAAQQKYDIVIVGGGIYGVMLALEATLRGCSVLLLEKDDFGAATSYNSLRVIHGGLRDLQTLDLRRYWTFGRERRWFLERFPDLVERLPVLVPLYQRGMLRTSVFRIAFMLDRLLLPRRDRELTDERSIPYGRVLVPEDVKRRFPAVDDRGLKGGALWYDAVVPNSQRLVMETLRCACTLGAAALNYTPATALLTKNDRVVGVRAQDTIGGAEHEFSADVVINAAGPWSREVAGQFDQDTPELYRYSMAWNILFDREALSDCALGIRPPQSGAQIHFVLPWKDRLLAGTGHAPRDTRDEKPQPSPDELRAHLQELNEAIPGLEVERRDILHVYAGYLPVEQGEGVHLAKEDRFIDHAERGGPHGLYSIGSSKLTAARSTADNVLSAIVPGREVTPERRERFQNIRAERRAEQEEGTYDEDLDTDSASWRTLLRQIIREESVHHLDDLVLRRTRLGDDPRRALELAPALCDLFDWDDSRCQDEVGRIENHFRWVERTASSSHEVRGS